MFMMVAKKSIAAPWPTECPFINEVIAIVIGWVAG
jgi:hypothetical protein